MLTNDQILGFFFFFSNSLSFEKAYCEYRLNRIENALKTIESANQQTDKLKELYGQVVITALKYLLTFILSEHDYTCSKEQG